MAHDREYGAAGQLGLAVPPANLTVEPEMAMLLPAGVSLHTTRLGSASPSPRQRLLDYVRNLDGAIESFRGAPLEALMFACTGSSYLIGREAEGKLVAALSDARGVPVITAANAVLQTLRTLGSERIALVTPYPDWLTREACRYWDAAGLQIAAIETVPIGSEDTRAIYGLRSATAIEALGRLSPAGADAILLSGTGMPTLRAIKWAAETIGIPVLSSNLCLAWQVLDLLGVGPAPGVKAWAGHGWGDFVRAWLERVQPPEAPRGGKL